MISEQSGFVKKCNEPKGCGETCDANLPLNVSEVIT
jgi:hypothetical protein